MAYIQLPRCDRCEAREALTQRLCGECLSTEIRENDQTSKLKSRYAKTTDKCAVCSQVDTYFNVQILDKWVPFCGPCRNAIGQA